MGVLWDFEGKVRDFVVFSPLSHEDTKNFFNRGLRG
jgi:hypothetical protein